MIEVKKNEKATAFMEMVKVKANLSDSQVDELEVNILQKYDSVYDFFETVAKKGIDSIRSLEFLQRRQGRLKTKVTKFKSLT